jgi:drug/metabolite transporter (DMT)-like permease
VSSVAVTSDPPAFHPTAHNTRGGDPRSGRFHVSGIDALLLLMALIWGTNYSVIKTALRQIDPQAFNAVRMVIASTVFLAILAGVRTRVKRNGANLESTSIFYTPAPMVRREWLGVVALGVIGHGVYQYCFIGGLARTSVANSSLMLAVTPVLIAISSAVLGHEPVSRWHWAGAALSLAGVYLVVGQGFSTASHGIVGDLLMLVAVCCWAAYTIGSQQLMARHSPVAITGLSMSIGTLLYVPAVWPHVRAVSWTSLSPGAWASMGYSGLFALCVAYTIWYAAVRQIGSARTSVYSNVIPLVAMATAVIFVGEPLGLRKIIGAAAVLTGVALTRVVEPSRPVAR